MYRKGQSMTEYAVIAILVVAVFLSMHTYLRRSIQGRLVSQADQLSSGTHYEPGSVTGETYIYKEVNEVDTACRLVFKDTDVSPSYYQSDDAFFVDFGRLESIAAPQR